MTQTQPGPNENDLRSASADTEPLAHLYKMSPTAGVATTDYAAINSAAIAAIVIGAASILAVLNTYLMFIPVAGTICGIVAVRQIRDSNGTQVGRGLAWGGLLLSVGVAGGVLLVQTIHAVVRHAAEGEITALIQQVGQQIHDEQYDGVYSQASRRLRERVPPEVFARQLKGLNGVPQLGKLQWLRWNDEPMAFEVNPDSGVQRATAMALEKMEHLADPGREIMIFDNESGKWALLDIPRLFPPEAKRQGPPGS